MPAKTTSKDKNKKLTDFFVPKPSSPLPASTAPEGMTTTTVSMTRSKPTTLASTAIITPPIVNSGFLSEGGNASLRTKCKRARSPDGSNCNASLLFPPKSMSPGGTKKIFHSPGRPKAVVRMTSPLPHNVLAHRQTPVRVPSSSSVASPSGSHKQVVYSSQSDEEELVLPDPKPRALGEVVEGVHNWRQGTSAFSRSPVPQACGNTMEVDLPLFVSQPPVVPSASRSANCSSLSDSNELPPFPPTPQPIDSETKTANIIAEIKARAFAACQSSEDNQPLAFRELEDSDDDDLIDDLPLVCEAKGKSVPSVSDNTSARLRTCRTPDRYSPSLQPRRASTRTRKSALSFHLPLTIAASSTDLPGTTKSVPVPSNRKKSRAVNPLQALLREKALEDKRGSSSVALRLAEEAVRQGGSCEASIDSDVDLDTIDQLRLSDEQAAWKAVHEFRKSSSPIESGSLEDFTIEDRESKMLGPAASEAIYKILAGNKGDKGNEKDRERDQDLILGFSLWTHPSDEDMEVDSMPVPPLSGHSILTCLDNVRGSGDFSLLNLILRSGALTAVPRQILLSNMSTLLAMVLFASARVADAIYVALRDVWTLNPQEAQMPFDAILCALVQLGANPAVLEELGLSKQLAPKNYVTHDTRLESLKRLIAIMKVAGFAGAFPLDDVANVVLSLIIMRLDPLTSSELCMQLNTTLDVVCNHGALDSVLRDIHGRVLGFARRLAPAKRAKLVSFFASGSGRTMCIARSLAYCLLVSVSTTPIEQAPPLEPLILLLSPEAGSRELFDVTNESKDYEELRHYVNILSVALIDVASYVEEERVINKSASSGSIPGTPNKAKKPMVPPLELLRTVLEALQAKIVDTRAAHLDRSRTKAAIQRLTMRIIYGRMALVGVRPRRRADTLKAYFSPQHR